MPRVVHDTTLSWVSEHWSDQPEPPPGVPAFGFLAVPFDHAVSHRAGTRFGPAHIRAALDSYSLYCADKRVSLERTHFHDFGAVDLVHDLTESYRSIRRAVGRVPAAHTLITLGGDHSITDPLVRGMMDRGVERLGMIVFDAHLDSREPIPGKEHSGHWMTTLEDVLDYRSAVQLGINAPIYGESYMRQAEERGILVRTPYEIRKAGWSAVVAEAVRHAGADTEGVYISLDIDAIDQAFAPGTSVPNPAGLLPHEVLDAVFEIACAANTVALDVVETSPPLDREDFTSHLAAQVVMHFIAGNVVRRRTG